MSNQENETFHLGLTMAGAVSAGSYTGGVLDYLFEVLDKWEKAKKGELEGVNLNEVPQHNVVIDAMGGTSAGGMTTSMAVLYALLNKVNPVTDSFKDEVGKPRNNFFYDSWVLLDDDPNKKTIEKALDPDDLKSRDKLKSALNSKFIDRIAENIFDPKKWGDDIQNLEEAVKNLPSYISKDLELLISHTALKGTPLEASFKNASTTLLDPPTHTSYEHFLMSHFKLNYGKAVDPKEHLWLNPFDERARKRLIKATIATGAFPIGLEYREFDNEDFNENYLQNIISRVMTRNLGESNPEIVDKIKWDESLKDFRSFSVDGGVINNEPYAEVLSVLKHRYHKNPLLDENCQPMEEETQNYGMVMIDPFPDFYEEKEIEENDENGDYIPKDLLYVTKKIIGTMWNQSKVKRNEMIEQFDNPVYRGVIFPKKKDAERNDIKHPIATGAMNGFSGFFEVNFRHHDFYLGRNNARNFLRAFLSFKYDPENGVVHPIHKNWTDEQVKKFKIEMKDQVYLPIIPDINMLLDGTESHSNIYDYTIPKIPTIPKEKILDLGPLVSERLKSILDLYFPLNPQPINQWYERLYRPLINWGRTLIGNYGKRKASGILSEKALNAVVKGLNEHELISPPLPKPKK